MPVSDCPEGEFRCNDRSMCLPQEQLCDHTEQCADGSDEDRCGEAHWYCSIRIGNQFQ